MSRFFESAWEWVKKYRTQLIAVAIWGTTLFALNSYMRANNLTFIQMAEQLGTILTDRWYGPIIYIVVYMIRPLILFPASLLTILAGNIYGLWPGFLYGLLAGTISSLIPYAVGRWFSEEKDAPEEAEGNLFKRFIGLMRSNPFQAVLTMRLLFFPYDAVSVVAGNLRLPVAIFFAATAIGNLAGAFSFVGFGASIEGNLVEGNVSINPAILGVSVLILIISIALSRYLKKRENEKLEETASVQVELGENAV